MPENANIKAALENLWDVVNEEGYELTQVYGQWPLPDGYVEIVRTRHLERPEMYDVRVCAAPISDTPAREGGGPSLHWPSGPCAGRPFCLQAKY